MASGQGSILTAQQVNSWGLVMRFEAGGHIMIAVRWD